MTRSIIDVLDKHFEDVKFDRNLCKRIIDFALKFVNRNEDHASFFGGVLLGVQDVKFHDTDREIWFDDVLGIDDDLLRHDFIKAEAIDKNHIVASDPFNHIPGYLARRFRLVTDVPINIKNEALISAFQVLHFKYLTSLLSRRFKYLAKREVAEATFATLNYKFDIKMIGSWGKLIRQRAEGIIDRDSIYAPFINDQDVDLDYWSKRIVTDTQTRLRELINKYYDNYIKTLKSGSRLVITSDVSINTDGEQVLKDKITGYASYRRYLHSIVTNESNFIKPEILGVVENSMKAMPPELLLKSLQYLSRNINQKGMEKYEKMIDECILYAFDYMQSIKSSVQRNSDLLDLTAKVRSKIMAPKSEDSRVLFMRDVGHDLVVSATNNKNPAYIAATRTGIMLYLILRAMTKNYYSR